MPRPKQRTAELRDHVVDSAMAILEAEGVAGLTARRVAQEAATSVPAVYELFGDKAGLVREMFFEGFRLMRERFDRIRQTDDSRADLVRVIKAIRSFAADYPVLADVMFSRPFADFDPGPSDLEAGAATRQFIMRAVRRAIDAGLIAGNAADISHALLALAQGLAAQERAGWLGTSKASRDRRWAIAVEALVDGLQPKLRPIHGQRA